LLLSATLGHAPLIDKETTTLHTFHNFIIMAAASPTSIFDFTATDIDGNEVNLSAYKDHVCIIVNVASK